MADRLKRAAAWLGLVTDDRYAEYEVDDASAPRASAARSSSAARSAAPCAAPRPAAAA